MSNRVIHENPVASRVGHAGTDPMANFWPAQNDVPLISVGKEPSYHDQSIIDPCPNIVSDIIYIKNIKDVFIS